MGDPALAAGFGTAPRPAALGVVHDHLDDAPFGLGELGGVIPRHDRADRSLDVDVSSGHPARAVGRGDEDEGRPFGIPGADGDDVAGLDLQRGPLRCFMVRDENTSHRSIMAPASDTAEAGVA